MASRISRQAAKSGCAREWGGWGRLSDDGPGQHNPDRSEGPWGRAVGSARTEVPYPRIVPDTEQGAHGESSGHEGRWQTKFLGKALSDIPALKPYRGKLAVRNFRGGDGNVGIIRSPVRAIALPDRNTVPEIAWLRPFCSRSPHPVLIGTLHLIWATCRVMWACRKTLKGGDRSPIWCFEEAPSRTDL